MIEVGTYKGQFALKVTFGYGLAAKNIGLLYKEKVDEQNEKKIRNAIEKLSEIINDPKITLLSVNKDLSSEIGLTFQEPIRESLIE